VLEDTPAEASGAFAEFANALGIQAYIGARFPSVHPPTPAMDLPATGFARHRIAIPSAFHATATGAPFETCIACQTPLLQRGVSYVVEKAIRRYPEFDMEDTVFEYAMCLPCYEQLQRAMSEESLRRVQHYFEGRVDFTERLRALDEHHTPDPDAWIAHCLVSGAPRASFTEYQIFCQCEGDRMVFTTLPYLIGGPTIDEIVPLLSNKTLDEIDGFMGRHFGLPPEWRKKWMDRPILFV
jgi:hypothetical protein